MEKLFFQTFLIFGLVNVIIAHTEHKRQIFYNL